MAGRLEGIGESVVGERAAQMPPLRQKATLIGWIEVRMDIIPVSLTHQWKQVRQLFREYHALVLKEHGIELDFQGIETEMR